MGDKTDTHTDLRQAAQRICADFPDEYWREELMIREASSRYDNGMECGAEANAAKYLAADAGFSTADQVMQTLGGFGYALEYDVERYWREARLLRIAPVSQEMILNYVAERTLGLPRSY